MGGLVAATVALFAADMFGGFDFTDEGSYYLSFVHPENVSDNQSSYFLFGGKLFAFLRHDIVAMRFVTMLATAGGTLIFMCGLGRLLERLSPDLLPDGEHRTLARSSAVVASFLAFAISPPALSYNFQNAFCLLAATGLLLTACARPRAQEGIDAGTWLALAGFAGLVGLDFFVKFSTSVPLAIAGVLFSLVVSPQSLWRKAIFFGGLLIGLTAIALLYFSFFQSYARWWTGIAGTADALIHGGYATLTLRRYAGDFTGIGRATLRDFIPVWAVALPAIGLVAALRAWPRWQARVAAGGGLLILGQLIWLTGALEFYVRVEPTFFLGCLVLLTALVAASHFAGRNAVANLPFSWWRNGIIAGFLFALPYIGSFGTSNTINQNCLYQLAPWFALAALLLADLDRIWRTAWPSRLGLLLLAVIAGSQFYRSYGVDPYRVAGGRAQQSVPTSIGDPGTTLRLDPSTHDFITTARQALQTHGFKPGDDLLVLFDLPGFVFAMGGASPGHPWYFYGTQNAIDLDLMRLNFIEPARRRHAFIVRNGFLAESVPLLRAAGLNFPDGYQLITPPMLSPFTRVPFEIWAPAGAPK